MYTSAQLPEANLRSPSYYLAHTAANCRHCGSSTRLLALAVPRTHEMLDGGMPQDVMRSDVMPPVGTPADVWQAAKVDALLFYVEALPDGVVRRLRQTAPNFRPARSAATHGCYWANHCEHCGAMLEDHELHCEPEGAFMPSSRAGAARIRLEPIQEIFEAVAGGYSPDPPFFGLMAAS